MEKERLDPWGTGSVKDYARLQSEFGIEPVASLLPRFRTPSPHLSRGIDFGQRDLARVLDAVDAHKPYAVMSGIKPTGDFHLGTKMTADDMVYFQSLSKKGMVYYAIADVEAYADNGLSFQQTSKIAIRNVADILALGLDPDRAVVYLQSENLKVLQLGTVFSKGVTNNMLRAIYGERQIGLYMSALYQAGDILMPQLPELGGPKPVLVPVGADQDPHIRLSRDLAARYHEEYGFVPPSSIYHRLMLSLNGSEKMSKRAADSLITLESRPNDASKKILTAFTGGRDTVEEQRRLGGRPDICPVYDLYRFHFAKDDRHVETVNHECSGGVRLCGECKQEVTGLVKTYLEEHRRKRDAMTKDAEDLLAKSRDYLSSKGR
ncbi:MAG: tryptophan--tRNA ligase [Nitrososphaerota archaeon]|nr:tryptophan--tRNA ligase [Nitrososphaerota archaeon]MDG6973330.1 tryptophan--tRNA ligase [Nitrososphaerota archaeon]MDG7009935.1 tryptophan--tRNA ligase [Nitrososphaerota archaeon]MDG7015804.1 tryptophan--tRNA ligase [Nitrososphaerota archaeon]MDG7027898.1 tryptophan--tRNA ligase [Nitrososphaerota archaeon]